MLGKVSVKTPGKIIISGEHSVVYHKPALVMAINLYTSSTVIVYENFDNDVLGYHIIIISAENLIFEGKYKSLEDL